MNIVFEKASNGETTCSADKVRLHSYYNPGKEASRFVEQTHCLFNPKYILVTEPALSYTADFFRKKFPSVILCCIRFTNDFNETNSKWDKTFFCGDACKYSVDLSEQIFNFMGEEGISSCFFTSWKPSEQAFPQTASFAWDEIKKAVMKSRSVLATRSYFASRWSKNSLRNCLFINKTGIIKEGNSPVLICASGPSLLSSIEKIRQYRNRFFLIAVSSALSPLVQNGIIPDLCISTDGGFWAKLHISFSMKEKGIPLAIPGEGSCFGSILENTTAIPLFYGDGISESILKSAELEGMPAKRNGSVSGTAVHFAMTITSGEIFYCGLDLSFSKGYAHTGPNELEKNDSRFDCRTRTLETRTYGQNMNNGSIEIYRSWFSSCNFNGRVFRLSDNYEYASRLDSIKNCNWDFFLDHTKDWKTKTKPEIKEQAYNFSDCKKLEMMKAAIKKNRNSREWKINAVPLETIVVERSLGLQNENEAIMAVDEKMNAFCKDLLRAIEK